MLMPRLYLFAEGVTEQAFAATVLRPHLANLGVYLLGPILVAHARKRRQIHRGGGRKYIPLRNDIVRFLKQESGSDVFFTTLIDLYAIPRDFPQLDQAEQLRYDPNKRVQCLEQAFARDIGDNRFVPHIQLHEFEAYLFSEPDLFGYFYDHHKKQIAALKKIADAHVTPESIDDGPDSAPSKRIIQELPDYEGAKPTVGPQVAKLIGLAKIRAKCPHFGAWLSRLEELGTVQGGKGVGPAGRHPFA